MCLISQGTHIKSPSHSRNKCGAENRHKPPLEKPKRYSNHSPECRRLAAPIHPASRCQSLNPQGCNLSRSPLPHQAPGNLGLAPGLWSRWTGQRLHHFGQKSLGTWERP